MVFNESVKLPKLLMGKGTEIPQVNKLLNDVIMKFREYSLDIMYFFKKKYVTVIRVI